MLKNRKILITRPQHQAQALCAAIAAAGGQFILLPTLEIKDPIDKSLLVKAAQNISHFDTAIFTSANAVWKTTPLLSSISSNLQIAAIGPATAHALQQANIFVNLLPPPPFNSEALLTMPTMQVVTNKRIVIFTGADGRKLLADTLSQRGAAVTVVASYQRAIPQVDATLLKQLQHQAIDIIVSTSVESLNNLVILFAHAKNWLLTIPLLVISERMQARAVNLGFSHIVLADNATDKAVFDALKIWYANC